MEDTIKEISDRVGDMTPAECKDLADYWLEGIPDNVSFEELSNDMMCEEFCFARLHRKIAFQAADYEKVKDWPLFQQVITNYVNAGLPVAD